MKNRKLVISFLAMIICMILIFTFSSKNSHSSNSTSKNLIDWGITIYEKISHQNINHDKMIKKLNHPVRKLAHYSIYFLLGIFVYQIFLYSNFSSKIILAISICFFYAIFDEFHQLFVPGRTGQIRDVFIDTMGAATSIFIFHFWKNRKVKGDKNSSKKVAPKLKICYIKKR